MISMRGCNYGTQADEPCVLLALDARRGHDGIRKGLDALMRPYLGSSTLLGISTWR